MEFPSLKKAAVRLANVGMARSSFPKVRLAASQDLASSRVYLIDSELEFLA
jgi:hypothetical protein